MKRSSQLPPPNLAAKPKQATQLKFFFNFPVQPEPALNGRLRQKWGGSGSATLVLRIPNFFLVPELFVSDPDPTPGTS